MPNALDTFRAQQEAADHVYGRLQEITDLLARLQCQVDAVTADAELRATPAPARSRVGWNGFRRPSRTSGASANRSGNGSGRTSGAGGYSPWGSR